MLYRGLLKQSDVLTGMGSWSHYFVGPECPPKGVKTSVKEEVSFYVLTCIKVSTLLRQRCSRFSSFFPYRLMEITDG